MSQKQLSCTCNPSVSYDVNSQLICTCNAANVHPLMEDISAGHLLEESENMPEHMPEHINQSLQTPFPIVNDAIKNNCISSDNMTNIMKSIGSLQNLMNNRSIKPLDLIKNPEFYNTIHDILDNLDEVNAVCVLNMNGQKCQSIAGLNKNPEILEQLQLLNTLLTIYMPIFIRIILLIENVLNNLSNEPSCNIDSSYLESIKMLKNRIIGSMYMDNINTLNFKDANNTLRKMSSQSVTPPQIQEHFTVTSDSVTITYYDIIIVIAIALFIYFYYFSF